MNDQTELSALRRKAGAGRAPSEGVGMTPAKAFRLALSKAAQDELSMAARVTAAKEERLKHAQLLETLEQDTLLVLLAGPQGGAGLAVLDSQVLAAIIEVQTMGRVSAVEAVARQPTRTDSAMCERILDRIMQGFEGHLVGGTAAHWASGFQFGGQVENVRLLGLALDDVDYRVFRLALDLADGAKSGEMLIALPAEGCRRVQSGGDGADSWGQSLGKTVNASQVEILAVLHRAQISLAGVKSLKPGDVVPVPRSAIAEVSMEGMDGRIVGHARLGQQNGFRALRISDGAVGAPLDAVMPDITTDAAQALPLDTAMPTPDVDLETDIPMVSMDMDEVSGKSPDIGLDVAADAAMAPTEGAALGDMADIPMTAMPMNMDIG